MHWPWGQKVRGQGHMVSKCTAVSMWRLRLSYLRRIMPSYEMFWTYSISTLEIPSNQFSYSDSITLFVVLSVCVGGNWRRTFYVGCGLRLSFSRSDSRAELQRGNGPFVGKCCRYNKRWVRHFLLFFCYYLLWWVMRVLSDLFFFISDRLLENVCTIQK